VSDFGVKLFGDWARGTQILSTANERFERVCDQAVLKEAHFLRGKMIQNITSGGAVAGQPFAPLSPLTLAVRQFKGFGGSKPLMVTGALRNSIAVVKTQGGVFVGIKRAGKSKGGKGGANLAELHEYGGGPWARPMTAKQRRFLAAAFKAAGLKFGDPPGGGVLRIKIPARPFVGPIVDKFAKPEDVKKRFWANVSTGMGGDFGTP
jgi:hypothetical protein